MMTRWILFAIGLLGLATFSGCVTMTRRDFYLLQYENRMLGRMEGLDMCGDILRHREEHKEDLGLNGMDALAEKAAKETDKKFRPEEFEGCLR